MAPKAAQRPPQPRRAGGLVSRGVSPVKNTTSRRPLPAPAPGRAVVTPPRQRDTAMKTSEDVARSKNSIEEASRLVADPAGGGASLDKVRDILFGVQMRDYERRFARLEERLLKDTSDLKDEVKKRVDALEQYIRSETGSLGDRLKSERDERVEAAAEGMRELRESSRAHEKRSAQLDEQLSKSQRDLREQILDQHRRLSEEIRQKVDEVLAALARETETLRADKTDRATLASLLTEMAMRLTDELRIPGAEDGGNG
jgi:chromosome segregation ATPase